MISKRELLSTLTEGVKREDSIMPLYAKHIEHTIEFSGLDKAMQDKFVNTMELLISESTARKATFNAIRKIVESSKQDSF